MGFDDLIKKGKEIASNKEYTEDAKTAYSAFSSKEGSYQDKAQEAYKEVQKKHSGDKKEEKK